MSTAMESAIGTLWFGLVLIASFWMRFDVPIWEAF